MWHVGFSLVQKLVTNFIISETKIDIEPFLANLNSRVNVESTKKFRNDQRTKISMAREG
jgi:hypothetical protein